MGIQKITSNILINKGLKLAKRLELKEIGFSSLKSARQYAKSRAIEALKCVDPHERLVILDKTSHKIIKEVEGNKHSVNPAGVLIPQNTSYVHGHPTIAIANGKTIATPISFQDFKAINEKNVKDIIAFNESGEFSALMKKADFQQLSEEQINYYQNIHNVYAFYEKNLIKRISKKFPKKLQNCQSFQELKNNFLELRKKGLNLEKILKMLENCNDIIKNSIGKHESKGIHKFWKDYADELGVIYKTNYTYLS